MLDYRTAAAILCDRLSTAYSTRSGRHLYPVPDNTRSRSPAVALAILSKRAD